MSAHDLPDSAVLAFEELTRTVTQLANLAFVSDPAQATALLLRASTLMAALEYFAESGGVWQGRIDERLARKTATALKHQQLYDQLTSRRS